MYAIESDGYTAVRRDPWRWGRYQVELAARLPYDLGHAGAAIEELGYDPIDADQRGQSYRLRVDPRCTAELDEPQDESAGIITVLLRKGDLQSAETRQAEDDLEVLYEELRSALSRRTEDNAYAMSLHQAGSRNYAGAHQWPREKMD